VYLNGDRDGAGIEDAVKYRIANPDEKLFQDSNTAIPVEEYITVSRMIE
jgi:hypothetical protein